MTIVGGNDSADGNDSLTGSAGGDIIFGNGGADSIVGNGGPDTIIGGFNADTIVAGTAADFIFGNEANDTINTGGGAGADTVFAGQGDDSVLAADGRDTLLGNEGNDTIRGGLGIDTITGGAGADLFAYSLSAGNGGAADGDNANAGGPVEFITDVNFAEDRFQVFSAIAFAAASSPAQRPTWRMRPTRPSGRSLALAGGGAQRVAATFTFNGRSYVGDRPGRRVRCVHRLVRPPDRHHRLHRHGRHGKLHDVSTTIYLFRHATQGGGLGRPPVSWNGLAD